MTEDTLSNHEIDLQKNKYLVFRLGDQGFAFEIRYVAEIIGLQKITPLPNEKNSIKGVINLRGRVIPVIDARLRLGLPERAYDDRTCIVVTQARNMLIGLIADAVSEVQTVIPEQIEPPPQLRKNRRTPFLRGLTKNSEQVTMILDLEALLFDEEIADLETQP